MRKKLFSRKLRAVLSVTLSIVMLIGTCLVVPTTAMAETLYLDSFGTFSKFTKTAEDLSPNTLILGKSQKADEVFYGNTLSFSVGKYSEPTNGYIWKHSWDHEDYMGVYLWSNPRYQRLGTLNEPLVAKAGATYSLSFKWLNPNPEGVPQNASVKAGDGYSKTASVKLVYNAGKFTGGTSKLGTELVTLLDRFDFSSEKGNKNEWVEKTVYFYVPAGSDISDLSLELLNASNTTAKGDKNQADSDKSVNESGILLDDITFAEVDDVTCINFENEIEYDGTPASSITGIGKGGAKASKDGNKNGDARITSENTSYVFATAFNDDYGHDEKFATIKRGSNRDALTEDALIALKAGRYTIEFDYLWYSVHNKANENEIFDIAVHDHPQNVYYRVDGTDVLRFCNAEILPEKTWGKASFEFTLDFDAKSFGFHVDNANKHIYIDNVVIKLIHPEKTTFTDMDGSNIEVEYYDDMVTVPASKDTDHGFDVAWMSKSGDVYKTGQKVALSVLEEGLTPVYVLDFETAVDAGYNGNIQISSVTGINGSSKALVFSALYSTNAESFKNAQGKSFSLDKGSYKVYWDYYQSAATGADYNLIGDITAYNSAGSTVVVKDLLPLAEDYGVWHSGEANVVLTETVQNIGVKRNSSGITAYVDNIVIVPCGLALFKYATKSQVVSYFLNDEEITAPTISHIPNLKGWVLDGTDKIYAPGAAIATADLPESASFTAAFGNYNNDFSNSINGETSNCLGGGVDDIIDLGDEHGKVLQLTNQAGIDRQAIIHEKSGSVTITPLHNLNKYYKVSFDYKHAGSVEGVTAKDTTLYMAFAISDTGMSTAFCGTQEDLITVKTTDTNWQRATAYVKAPDTYDYEHSYNNAPTEILPSLGRIGLGIRKTDKVVGAAIVQIDNLVIEPVDAKFIFANSTTSYKNYDNGLKVPEFTSIESTHWIDEKGATAQPGDDINVFELSTRTYTEIVPATEDIKIFKVDSNFDAIEGTELKTEDGETFLRVNLPENGSFVKVPLSVSGKALSVKANKTYLAKIEYRADSNGTASVNQPAEILFKLGGRNKGGVQLSDKAEFGTNRWVCVKATGSDGASVAFVLEASNRGADLPYVDIKSVQFIEFDPKEYRPSVSAELFVNTEEEEKEVMGYKGNKVIMNPKSAIYNYNDAERTMIRFVGKYNYKGATNILNTKDGLNLEITARRILIGKEGVGVNSNGLIGELDRKIITHEQYLAANTSYWRKDDESLTYSVALKNVKKATAEYKYALQSYIILDVTDGIGTDSWGIAGFNKLTIASEVLNLSVSDVYNSVNSAENPIGWYK